ncbi:MAG: DUF4422 domain-containing protein [Bifidobacteriaceae bacterium]|nr:DUF4422 domain-containing protein [Bifidobacteriaceae bacterium]
MADPLGPHGADHAGEGRTSRRESRRGVKVKVLVAAHKPYRMPADGIYLPIQVGRSGASTDIGIKGDDTGENISAKNPNYCELTAAYWAWKNLTADYIGLAHYRRHFVGSHGFGDPWGRVLTGDAARALLSQSDVILPKKRRYIIESVYSHYIHAHHRAGIDAAIATIRKHHPDYAPACAEVLKRNWAHMFNMFIMKWELFDAYCAWLFDVLFRVEQELDMSSYSSFEARVLGRLSELLLDVWIERNGIVYKEVPVAFMEPQNWLRKGGSFVLRRFGVIHGAEPR